MKRLSLFIVCLLYFAGLLGQNIYFNKTFKPDSINTLSPAVLTVADGYLIAHTYNAISANEGFGIRKLNHLGETQWFKNLNYGIATHTLIGGGGLIKTLDNNYMLTSAITQNSTDEDYDIVLFKFKENGDTVWSKKIISPNKVDYAYSIIPTSESGYIMAGIQRNFGQNNRFFVLKTDSLGNEEWSNQYHPLQHGAAFSVFETEIGYIISGYVEYPLTDGDLFIMEIDKQGNLVWEKNYGGIESDSAGLLLCNNNQTYFVAGTMQQNNIYRPFVALINNIGDTLWTKTYDVQVGALQEAPLQSTPDGGFVCLYSYDTELGYRAPWFWRFTSTGDTLWTRRIPGAPSNNNTYLKDIAPTPDGGWVLSGFNYSQQSSWVVKTDSLGYTCSFIGCDSTVVVEVLPGIPSNANPEVSAMVYPVPASTHLNIRYQIPAGILPSGDVDWRLYDALGRQVAEETLYGSRGTVQVSVELLPAGIYYYRVVLPASGQTVAGGKVVVE